MCPRFSQTLIHRNSHCFICHAVPFCRTFPLRGFRSGPSPPCRKNDQLGYCQFNVAWIWGFKEMDSQPERAPTEKPLLTQSPLSAVCRQTFTCDKFTTERRPLPFFFSLFLSDVSSKWGEGRLSQEVGLQKTWIHKEQTFLHVWRALSFQCFDWSVLLLLLYPVPSLPVSSRHDSGTPRTCTSPLFSTLMCCYQCLLQTDPHRASKIWQALGATYFTWGRQLSAVRNWFPQNICTLKPVVVVPAVF